MNTTPPYYVFNKHKFTQMISQYMTYASVYYPIKANDHPTVVATAAEHGCSFEVDSIEHIRYLIKDIGVAPENILYSFPVKQVRDIEEAHSYGIMKYVVDTESEYKKISAVSKNACFFVRIFIYDVLKVESELWKDKWGATISKAIALIETINKQSPSRFLGISFYIPKEIPLLTPFITMLTHLKNEFTGFTIPCLNIGGGISLERLSTLTRYFSQIKEQLHTEEIIVEPGRHLLNPCIDMHVEVIDIRRVNDQRIVIINAGIYSGLLDARLKGKRFPVDDTITKGRKHAANICGNSSDSDDYLGVYDLRESLKVGDQLVIHDCGAYSSVMRTHFYMKKSFELYQVDTD